VAQYFVVSSISVPSASPLVATVHIVKSYWPKISTIKKKKVRPQNSNLNKQIACDWNLIALVHSKKKTLKCAMFECA